MRAWLRLGPNFGISMPWWIAIFVGMVWLMLALMYLLYGLTVVLVVLAARGARTGWQRVQQARARG